MLAIALGDPTGIGPEVPLKAVAAELPRDDQSYLLIGEPELVRKLNERLKIGLALGISKRHASPLERRSLTRLNHLHTQRSLV